MGYERSSSPKKGGFILTSLRAWAVSISKTALLVENSRTNVPAREEEEEWRMGVTLHISLAMIVEIYGKQLGEYSGSLES